MEKVQASARVLMQIEIDVPDSWGGDCPTSQIHRQAKESALEALRKGSGHLVVPRWRIIGEPEVTAILVTRKS